ncbi:DUF4349 domain-containing protein [Qipengyuania vesicularis]|uniref:DUF4349 domain-containing protein n=1 Tax=Qipengyuania vesicularis TaxID=2867232 RepID=UPI001C872480|nr:DUF4349 domain-containing protein [Qipengyuania vesicularis]MBX7526202.1 DUF4349 domain-containing protein [Qipengyuania vesicularis]
MNIRTLIFVGFSGLLAAGCSEAEPETSPRDLITQVEPRSDDSAPQTSFGFMEAMETGPDLFGEDAPTARDSVARVTRKSEAEAADAKPADAATLNAQIAYTYGYGFRIGENKIDELQQAHVAMCQSLGTRCRVMRISRATADSWDGFGELELQIAADDANTFGGNISGPAERLGGELVSSVRDGEDLSEQIIDSEARLESRLLLREKLTAILRNNRGSVDELLKAEKAVADVNEEIDATRSKLEKLRNRIRYSAVRIEYEPFFGETQLGFSRPVMTAARSIGTTLGTSIGFLIYAITFLTPIILLLLALRWILHRFGLRIRWWRNPKAQAS